MWSNSGLEVFLEVKKTKSTQKRKNESPRKSFKLSQSHHPELAATVMCPCIVISSSKTSPSQKLRTKHTNSRAWKTRKTSQITYGWLGKSFAHFFCSAISYEQVLQPSAKWDDCNFFPGRALFYSAKLTWATTTKVRAKQSSQGGELAMPERQKWMGKMCFVFSLPNCVAYRNCALYAHYRHSNWRGLKSVPFL